MHAHISVLLIGWTRRVVRFVAVLILALSAATPALAQDMPAGGRTGGLLNILLLAGIAFFLIRSFRRRNGDDKTRPGRWNPTDRDDAQADDEQADRQSPTVDRHEAARQAWDILSSQETERAMPTTPTGQPPEVRADGFDEVEFLEGAKVLFARFQQAREQGDFADIRDFMSDDVFNEAMAGGEQERIEVMLLSARLVELKSEGGRTTATVFYDARLRTGGQGERTEHVRQVWEFSRNEDRADALWVLDGIDKVDQ